MVTLTAKQAGPNMAVVQIGRSLDFRNAANFRGLCRQMVDQGIREFVLDFTDTGILDSTGLGAIFSVYREINPTGGRVAFASVSRPVQTVVKTTHSYRIFPQFNTVHEATAMAA